MSDGGGGGPATATDSGIDHVVKYVLAAQRPRTVLGEYTSARLKGNFKDMARLLLDRFWAAKDQPIKSSYDIDGYTFLLVSQGQHSVLLLHPTGAGDADTLYGFLFGLFDRLPLLPAGQEAQPAEWSTYEGSRDVSTLIGAQLSNTKASKLRAVNEVITETTALMKKNVALVIERGDKLEHLVVESSRLESNAGVFAKASRKLKCAIIRKNFKLCIILLAVLALVLIVAAYMLIANVRLYALVVVAQ